MYLILPEGLQSDGQVFVRLAAERYGCHVELITGLDWDKDMTPWEAEPIFKRNKVFAGKAEEYLPILENHIKQTETALGLDSQDIERCLAGISLSGLFALWAAHRSDMFCSIACLSASFWYPGFEEWVKRSTLSPHVRRIHISLGNREKISKNPNFSSIEDHTLAIVQHLRSLCGVTTDYRSFEGTHFSPIVPRLEEALKLLMQRQA